jgi:hypothetical protein
MTAPAIFFPGDKVRATVSSHPVTGVIESFTYDVDALFRGEPGDIAHVRMADGEVVRVPAADLEGDS